MITVPCSCDGLHAARQTYSDFTIPGNHNYKHQACIDRTDPTILARLFKGS